MAVFEVWDPEEKPPSVIFQEEKNANGYRAQLEKKHQRLFRIRKLFGEIKAEITDGLEVVFGKNGFTPGDVIVSKTGILMESEAGTIYRVKQLKVREDGTLVAMKREMADGIQ